MWYKKREGLNGTWLVYQCSTYREVLVKTFKTEKGADNYIAKRS